MEINEVRSKLEKSSKRAGLISLIGLVVFIGGLIASFYVYKIELAEVNRQIKEKRDELVKVDKELQEKQQRLDETEKTFARYQNYVKSEDPTAANEAITKTIENNPLANQVLLDVTSKAAAPDTVPPPKGAQVAFCANNDVNIRKNHDKNSEVIGKLQKGHTVYLMEESENQSDWKGRMWPWVHIQTEKGQQGWVLKPFIVLEEGKSAKTSPQAKDNPGIAVQQYPLAKKPE